MSERTLYLRPPLTKDLLDSFVSFAGEFLGPTSVGLSIRTNAGLGVSVTCPAGDIPRNKQYTDFDEAASSKAFVETTSLTFEIQGVNRWYIVYKGNSTTASISFGQDYECKQPPPPSVDIRCLLNAFEKHFALISSSDLARSNLPQMEREALDYRETALKSLESQTSRLGEILTKQAINNDEYIRKATEGLEKKFQEREEALERKNQERRAELDAHERDFAKRVSEFDARENTTVRRELLNKIRQLLEGHGQFKISKETAGKRRIIHAICFATLVATGILAGCVAKTILEKSAFDWHLIPMFSAGVLVFASTLVFYLRWNDQWFKEHAHAEFHNKKTDSDILRASWIAELHFEWKDKKQADLPADLINSFTRNLFTDPYARDVKHHPLDQLTDLVGKVARIKVDQTGLEIDGAEAKPKK